MNNCETNNCHSTIEVENEAISCDGCGLWIHQVYEEIVFKDYE